ncbi:MAG: hypothetical protein JW759_04040 [Candidatus Coatesbacteria bacterium]|nr:hypothetical protein [Candidatus Coatesbacteria bacterium]
MTQSERVITLTLSGPATEDARVSVALMASKLTALQKSFYNVASGVLDAPMGRRGGWSSHVRSACELFFVESAYGSPLQVRAQLAEEAEPIIPCVKSDPVLCLEKYREALRAISAGDSRALAKVLPDTISRLRAVRSIEELYPAIDGDYYVEVGNHSGPWVKLGSEDRLLVRDTEWVSRADGSTSLETITGRLVLIRVGSGPKKVAVLTKQQEITCFYPAELEDTISQMVAGSIVEVIGSPTYRDGPKQIELQSIEPVELLPFRKKRFVWGGRIFELQRSVSCLVDFSDGVWTYECEELGLYSYAHSRAEASRRFNEEFAFDWDDIAQEDDDKLAPDALRLKKHLRELVENVETYEDLEAARA